MNTFSKQTENYLNECEHFLKANWDRSKRVWTLSQSKLRWIWTSVNTFSKQTEIDLSECKHFLIANWDRNMTIYIPETFTFQKHLMSLVPFSYIKSRKQTWRPPFLKHSLSWITCLRYKIKDLVTIALQRDFWIGANIQENNTDFAVVSGSSPQQEQRLNPGTTITSGLLLHPPSPLITPSKNSAFVQVRWSNTSNKFLELVSQDFSVPN